MLSYFLFFISVTIILFIVFIIIIILYCRPQKYKRQLMNMRFDYLSNYIEDPIELRHYRERNNLSFEEEINTCTTDS